MNRRIRAVLTGLGWAAVGGGVLGVLARAVAIGWQPAILLAAFYPFAVLLALGGGVVLTVLRRWLGVAVVVLLVAWTAIVQAPLWAGATSAPPGVPFVVLQANLRVGGADPHSLVRRIRDEHVELFTADELTTAELGRLQTAGIDRLLPHRLVTPYPGGAGTGIWSRYPLTAMEKHDEFTFELLAADVDVASAAPVRVVAVHLLPPWPYPSVTWLREIRRLRSMLTAAPRTVVAAGDYNSTLDNPQLRTLLRDGYADAAERVGAGYQPTYPTDRIVGPVLTLDHVITRGATPVSLTAVPLPGSDHRGLLAHLVLPAN